MAISKKTNSHINTKKVSTSSIVVTKNEILSKQELISDLLEKPNFSSALSEKINVYEKFMKFSNLLKDIDFSSFFKNAVDYSKKVLSDLDNSYILLSNEIYTKTSQLLVSNIEKGKLLQISKIKNLENEEKLSSFNIKEIEISLDSKNFSVMQKLVKTNATLKETITKLILSINEQKDNIVKLYELQKELDHITYIKYSQLSAKFAFITDIQENMQDIIEYSAEFIYEAKELKEKFFKYSRDLKERIDYSQFNFEAKNESSDEISAAALFSLKNDIFVIKTNSKPVNIIKNIKK